MSKLTNRVLQRQLKKLGLNVSEPPKDTASWNAFLTRVERAYAEADEDRYTLERSLNLSSKEMNELYNKSRKTSESLLKKEKDKLDDILSALAEGVVVLNEDNRISYINPAAERALNINSAAIFDSKFDRLFGAYGWEESLYNVLSERKKKVFETRLNMGEGKVFPAEIKYSPLLSENDRFIGSVIAFHDISNQKEFEGTLQKAKEEALIASEHKSNYLAEMSHEIRTPLNSILSLIQLLAYSDLDESQTEDLETLESCVYSLRQMINDVLDLSKIEAGKFALQDFTFSLSKSLRKIEKQFHGSFQEKNLKVTFSLDLTVPDLLCGDNIRLEQIITNLVSNAVKFTPQGGTIEVKTIVKELTSKNVEIEFHVIDSGFGVPEDKQEKIFHAFEQADDNVFSKHGGTGLGLHICKRLTALMGGEISLKSKVDSGSEFIVKIPLKIPSKANIPEKITNVRPVTHTDELTSARKAKVLLIEDNLVNQTAICRLLTHKGYEVTTADSGSKALKAIENKKFDIILMDLHMPGMDGIETTEKIRSGPQESNSIPIIALTAHVVQGVEEKCLEAGMNGFMSKPIEYSELFSVIEKQLGK